MEAFANESGLLPEQVWDAADIPEQGLYLGRPSGSAMPLVWAHAEYVKLRRSLHDGRVFDTPPQPVQRYLVEKTGSPHVALAHRPAVPVAAGGQGAARWRCSAPAVVHWSSDGWRTAQDAPDARHRAGRPLRRLADRRSCRGGEVVFTFQWARGRPLGGEGFPRRGDGGEWNGRAAAGRRRETERRKPNALRLSAEYAATLTAS